MMTTFSSRRIRVYPTQRQMMTQGRYPMGKAPEHISQDHWKKGQSGNASGGREGLGKASRGRVGEDGQKLAELWWSIANDETQRSGDRLEASRLLAERGWGKAAGFTLQEGDPLGFQDVEQAAEE